MLMRVPRILVVLAAPTVAALAQPPDATPPGAAQQGGMPPGAMRPGLIQPAGMLLGGPQPDAARAAAVPTIGPGRIVCNASFCELGIGTQPRVRFRVDVSALPEADTRRLRKCTGVSQPCIVTVKGGQVGDTMRIVATGIQWHEQTQGHE
jgi:hypothetical protein